MLTVALSNTLDTLPPNDGKTIRYKQHHMQINFIYVMHPPEDVVPHPEITVLRPSYEVPASEKNGSGTGVILVTGVLKAMMATSFCCNHRIRLIFID